MAMANLKEMQFISHLSSSEAGFPRCDNANVSSLGAFAAAESLQVDGDPVSVSSVVGCDLLEESGRGCRTKKRHVEPLCCPVCSVTLRATELETHYMAELGKLEKLSSNGRRKSTSAAGAVAGGPSAAAACGEPPETVPPEKCWETYQTVKANRQGRLKVKSRKRKADDVTCPVCNQPISGDLNLHVEECLRKNGSSSSDDEADEDIDVGGDDFGEYEWAGQHRVRASSMLEGGYSAAGIGTCLTRVRHDEEEDLVVDGDDSDKFGPPQYSERDIMLVSRGEDKEQTALRLAIIGSDASPGDHKRHPDDADADADEDSSAAATATDEDDTEHVNGSANPTIEALKQRVRELENRDANRGQYKCLICMGRYRTPVISICCWHVHCEVCWLKTLGIKKLCPQCNMITSPTDLRKVYI